MGHTLGIYQADPQPQKEALGHLTGHLIHYRLDFLQSLKAQSPAWFHDG